MPGNAARTARAACVACPGAVGCIPLTSLPSHVADKMSEAVPMWRTKCQRACRPQALTAGAAQEQRAWYHGSTGLSNASAPLSKVLPDACLAALPRALGAAGPIGARQLCREGTSIQAHATHAAKQRTGARRRAVQRGGWTPSASATLLARLLHYEEVAFSVGPAE